MVKTKQDKNNVNDTLSHILNLSWRISVHSPPMKPFIRFSRQMDGIFEGCGTTIKTLFWDFDYNVQKILLCIANELVSPEQLAHLCIERWKANLKQLCVRKKKELKELIESNRHFRFQYTPRDEFIIARIRPQSQFLYVGCGTGTECLRIASRGHNVCGIDTDFTLTEVANRWAEHLNLPVTAVCMDTLESGFQQESFDGFLIEFYGHQPSTSEAQILQRSLAGILRDGGKGFIVANRKKYASYWFLMGTRYPGKMTDWLIKQSVLDHRFSQPDSCEEQLNYGLYRKTHTINSLSHELRYTFNVLECIYEKHDPRYVMCVVEKKKNSDPISLLTEERKDSEMPLMRPFVVTKHHIKMLCKIESVCDFLEMHEKSVLHFFENKGLEREKSPLLRVKTGLEEIIELLEDIFADEIGIAL